ncbi:type II toxin-antitoxin system HicB family antitoxin [Desulfonatronum thiodismutans]|uniref:type II toxin-antitoxin system HicB family antitoxin n=1 Tax=Desulfonatronum thiodismutans TaxID=159290 RepID=UPI0004ABD717|nr:type II toxin-antitoxin system HicB family antitoxin [Desulfonatronum thiodismutans]
MAKDFFVVVEKDEDGFFVGEVPSLRACYAQGRTMEEMLSNIQEVIEMCIEEPYSQNEFIGVQKVSIDYEPSHAHV